MSVFLTGKVRDFLQSQRGTLFSKLFVSNFPIFETLSPIVKRVSLIAMCSHCVHISIVHVFLMYVSRLIS